MGANKNTSPTINIIAALISIGISSIYLTYILHLEKSNCMCSLNWRQRFIKKYIIAMIIFIILNMVRKSLIPQLNYLELPINVIYGILFIVYFCRYFVFLEHFNMYNSFFNV